MINIFRKVNKADLIKQSIFEFILEGNLQAFMRLYNSNQINESFLLEMDNDERTPLHLACLQGDL